MTKITHVKPAKRTDQTTVKVPRFAVGQRIKYQGRWRVIAKVLPDGRLTFKGDAP